MRIFLDACAIIYWVEMAKPYYQQLVNKLHQIRDHHGALPFCTSELSLLECQVKPLREKNKVVLDRYHHFFNANEMTLIPIHLDLIQHATMLRANYNLATPDAIQAACALSLSEEIIFLTNDTTFKKIPHLDVVKI